MTPHMREVKEVFRKASAPVVTKVGWAAVFATYDTDGSGALDKEEFIGKSPSRSFVIHRPVLRDCLFFVSTGAVRKDCDISERVVSGTHFHRFLVNFPLFSHVVLCAV